MMSAMDTTPSPENIQLALETLGITTHTPVHQVIAHQHPTLWRILIDEAGRVRRGEAAPWFGRAYAYRRAIMMLCRSMIEQHEAAASSDTTDAIWLPVTDSYGRPPAYLAPDQVCDCRGIIHAGQSAITVGMDRNFSFTGDQPAYLIRVISDHPRGIETVHVHSRPGDLRLAIEHTVARTARC